MACSVMAHQSLPDMGRKQGQARYIEVTMTSATLTDGVTQTFITLKGVYIRHFGPLAIAVPASAAKEDAAAVLGKLVQQSRQQRQRGLKRKLSGVEPPPNTKQRASARNADSRVKGSGLSSRVVEVVDARTTEPERNERTLYKSVGPAQMSQALNEKIMPQSRIPAKNRSTDWGVPHTSKKRTAPSTMPEAGTVDNPQSYTAQHAAADAHITRTEEPILGPCRKAADDEYDEKYPAVYYKSGKRKGQKRPAREWHMRDYFFDGNVHRETYRWHGVVTAAAKRLRDHAYEVPKAYNGQAF